MDTNNPYRAPEADMQMGSRAPSAETEPTPVMLQYLRETKPWVRFLTVLGFIGMAFLILGALAVLVMGAVGGMGGVEGIGMGVGMALLYLVMAAVYFLPLVHMHRYANAIGRALQGGGTEAVEEALMRQRSFWRTIGIITLVFLLLYPVIFIVAMLGAAFAG